MSTPLLCLKDELREKGRNCTFRTVRPHDFLLNDVFLEYRKALQIRS